MSVALEYRYAVDMTWWEKSSIGPHHIEHSDTWMFDSIAGARNKWQQLGEQHNRELPYGRRQITLGQVQILKRPVEGGKWTNGGLLEGTRTARFGWPTSPTDGLSADEVRTRVREQLGMPIRKVPA